MHAKPMHSTPRAPNKLTLNRRKLRANKDVLGTFTSGSPDPDTGTTADPYRKQKPGASEQNEIKVCLWRWGYIRVPAFRNRKDRAKTKLIEIKEGMEMFTIQAVRKEGIGGKVVMC